MSTITTRKGRMSSVELPEDLRYAIELELSHFSPKKLSKIVSDLSNRYRTRKEPRGQSFIRSKEDVYAYAAFRMPATFAAVYSALKQMKKGLEDWAPHSLLDVGAGPGTVMWAANEIYPSLNTITLLEREEGMIALGKRLAKHSSSISIKHAKWVKTDITVQWETSAHDLVIASYVLGELSEQDRHHFVQKLWEVTKGTLLIIEPGTPAGFSRIRQARKQLIDAGALITAPCTHPFPCPMPDDNWCHFSQRISRSRLHRQVKFGELSYEDEKFSFIAVSRGKGKAFEGRILRHPQVRKGHIMFEICSSDGISSRVISRKDKKLYRYSRKLSWGSSFPPN